jgi:hypothetical protein
MKVAPVHNVGLSGIMRLNMMALGIRTLDKANKFS